MAHNHVYGICESKCKEDVYSKKRVDEMLNGNVTLDIIENTLVEAFEFSDGTEIACYGGNPLVFDRNETYDSDDQWIMLAGTVSKIYKTPRQFKKGDVVKVYTGSSDTGDLIQAYVCWLDELPETIDLEKDCVYEDAHAIAEDEAGVVVELTLTRDAFGYLLLRFTKDESELNEGTLSVKNAKYFTATNAKAQLKHYDTVLEFDGGGSGGDTPSEDLEVIKNGGLNDGVITMSKLSPYLQELLQKVVLREPMSGDNLDEPAVNTDWLVVRTLSESDLVLYGLSSSEVGTGAYPYTHTKTDNDRLSYPYFDIPVEYGYIYKVEFTTGLSEAFVGVHVYNQTAMDIINVGTSAFSESDRTDSTWQSSGYEITIPYAINNSPAVCTRLTFKGSGTMSIGDITSVTISRKKVIA